MGKHTLGELQYAIMQVGGHAPGEVAHKVHQAAEDRHVEDHEGQPHHELGQVLETGPGLRRSRRSPRPVADSSLKGSDPGACPRVAIEAEAAPLQGP